jgi:hypothetical protein
MQINEQHRLCEQSLKAGLVHARNAGEILLQVKAGCRHGEWLSWLAANCQMSEQTGQRYMRIARSWPELEAKASRVTDLSYRDALKLLSHATVESEPAESQEAEANAAHPLPMPVHPALAEFRDMTDEEYGPFKESIREHGLLMEITLYQGMILDGRQRYRACLELGIEPRFREYTGDDPEGYVLIMNLYRMHRGAQEEDDDEEDVAAEREAAEAVIRAGKGKLAAMAAALTEIRDGRLYGQEFSSFADYCHGKWGLDAEFLDEFLSNA